MWPACSVRRAYCHYKLILATPRTKPSLFPRAKRRRKEKAPSDAQLEGQAVASPRHSEGALLNRAASHACLAFSAAGGPCRSLIVEPHARSSRDRDMTGTPPSHAIPDELPAAVQARMRRECADKLAEAQATCRRSAHALDRAQLKLDAKCGQEDTAARYNLMLAQAAVQRADEALKKAELRSKYPLTCHANLLWLGLQEYPSV